MADTRHDADQDNVDLPNISELFRPLLQTIPERKRPILYAIAERMAAERYRAWADQVQNPSYKAGLLDCARREDEIASRIESLYPDPAAIKDEIAVHIPGLAELNSSLFSSYSLPNQYRLQARGERLGAALWRALAQSAIGTPAHQTFLDCALLEEASAEFLETLLGL